MLDFVRVRLKCMSDLVFFSSSLTTESRAEPVGFLGEYPRVTDDQLKLALGWMPRLRLPVFCAVHVSHISGSRAGVIPRRLGPISAFHRCHIARFGVAAR